MTQREAGFVCLVCAIVLTVGAVMTDWQFARITMACIAALNYMTALVEFAASARRHR